MPAHSPPVRGLKPRGRDGRHIYTRSKTIAAVPRLVFRIRFVRCTNCLPPPTAAFGNATVPFAQTDRRLRAVSIWESSAEHLTVRSRRLPLCQTCLIHLDDPYPTSWVKHRNIECQGMLNIHSHPHWNERGPRRPSVPRVNVPQEGELGVTGFHKSPGPDVLRSGQMRSTLGTPRC